MELFIVIALIGIALLGTELLLPTGGVLAVLGAAGLVAGGILALDSGNDGTDVIGPALITLGVISLATFFVVARKVLDAHREEPTRGGGAKELIGALAEVRSTLDPEGQVWIEGALWRARLAGDAGPVQLGDRVSVDAIEGLTLVVSPHPPTGHAEGGAS